MTRAAVLFFGALVGPACSGTGPKDTDPRTAAPPCATKGQWVSVEAGNNLTCGIHADGCAECWGLGGDIEYVKDTGDDGYFVSGEDRPPRDVAFRQIELVELGSYGGLGYHGCGVLSDSTVRCWGRNDSGQADAPNGEFIDLDVFDLGTCGIRRAGEVECWGDPYPSPAGTFQDLEIHFGIGAALGSDGSVTCWEASHVTSSWLPETVKGPFSAVGGGILVVAIRLDGSLQVWSAGKGGNDKDFAPLTPKGEFLAACASTDSVCALDTKGTPQCFGEYPDDPILDVPEGLTLSSVSCGAGHVCGVTPDQEIVCWGDLSHGEGTPPS